MSRPNILLVVADDHAANAVGCYGGPHRVTPQIDRVAAEGVRFDACGCTNSLCSPSRATIMTGTYNHRNGVTTLSTEFDHRQPTLPALLQEAGYRTALFGKWHLGHGGVHDPRGFDTWPVLPDHHVAAHRGLRTRDRKLVHYYGSGCGQPGASECRTDPEWELFDLEADPDELRSVYDDPTYSEDVERLTEALDVLARELGDDLPDSHAPTPAATAATTARRAL